VTARRHETMFPGFREMARRRKELSAELTNRRLTVGLSQTEVAARMGTSQSAVARLEAGEGDIRLSTLERYAAAVGMTLDWQLGERKR
jgi:transcriptional regulator with XRE-family HTH domain